MNDPVSRLTDLLRGYPSAVIAFSGGVDSTFLAAAAGREIPRLLLVTASSSTFPDAELARANALASELGIPHRVIEHEETDIPGFSDNTPERCYFCKRGLFSLIREIADREGCAAVFDGSNLDDLQDYRPGRRALAELGVVSPLCEAGLTKDDIRIASRELGLPTADKPSMACLASRFPYGETITSAGLARVGKAEEGVRALGFRQVRVRCHGNLARVEVGEEELDSAWAVRGEIVARCKNAGFVFVAMDLQGYRTGAMNEAL